MGEQLATAHLPSARDGVQQVSTGETLRLRGANPAVHVPPSIVRGRSRSEYLVELPKVMLLIDGDAVADAGWPDYPLPVRRKSLVDNIAGVCSASEAAAQIVFDASLSPRSPYSQRSQSVEVRLSNASSTPAAALFELVQRHSSNRPLVVVSNNRRFSGSAEHRAESLQVKELLDLFLRLY